MPRLLALVLLAALLVACSGDDDEPTATAAPMPTASVTQPATGVTPDVVRPTPYPTMTPLPTPQRRVDGLLTDPRPRRIDRRVMLGPPNSPFPEHDRESVVAYDVIRGRQYVFEPGRPVGFRGDWFLYTASASSPGFTPGDSWLVDMRNGQRYPLGRGAPSFLDAETVTIWVSTTERGLFDLTKLAPFELVDLPEPRRSLVETLLKQDPPLGGVLRNADGSVLASIQAPPAPCNATTAAFANGVLCGVESREDQVFVDGNGGVIMRFRALAVWQGVPGELLVLTSPQCSDGGKLVWCPEAVARQAGPNLLTPTVAGGTTNLFTLDVATGRTKFIATVEYGAPNHSLRGYIPVTGDERYIVWTDRWCYPPKGKTHVYDRRTGTITEYDASLWVHLVNGLLRAGEGYETWLIDPSTGRRAGALPDNALQIVWSEDNRYAALGTVVGRGGPCI